MLCIDLTGLWTQLSLSPFNNRQKISLILAQIYVHPELIWIGKFAFWPSPLRIEGADSIALRGIFRDISQCEGNLFWKGFRWCMKGSERKSSNPDQFVWDSLSAILYHKSLRLCIFLSLHKKECFVIAERKVQYLVHRAACILKDSQLSTNILQLRQLHWRHCIFGILWPVRIGQLFWTRSRLLCCLNIFETT